MARLPSSSSTITRRRFVRLGANGATAGALVSSTTGSATAQATGQTHTIEMTDDLVFDPDEYTIAPGDTVVWENVGTIGHSVTAYENEIPAEATYFASGGLDTEDAARVGYPQQGDVPGGESYQHTFDVEGTYEYFCVPHESAGMVATLDVTAETGGGGGPVSILPGNARSLLLGALGALGSVLFLVYFFIKYGGDYDER